ncbi:MAG TPA: hypothetical protein VGC32_18235 [Solirubrobacterales bacterium]
MKKPRITPDLILPIALSAVFSLAIAQGLDLGHLVVGSGPASTWSIVGSAAGLISCALSFRYGLRRRQRGYDCW